MTFNVTTGSLEIYTASNAWDSVTSSFDTTGGTKDTTSRSGYNVHTFTSDGNFTWSGGPISNCEYVCIGGGGAGGDYAGPYPGYNSGAGGGGAGGMRSGTFLFLAVDLIFLSQLDRVAHQTFLLQDRMHHNPQETKHKVVVHRSSHLIWSPVQ